MDFKTINEMACKAAGIAPKQEPREPRQITREEAIALHDSGAWKNWPDDTIVGFQLFQDCLAIPFSRFHEAVEKVLGRPVFTHEFAFADQLRAEYRKERAPKTFDEIMALIPEDKLLLVVRDESVQAAEQAQGVIP